MILRALGVIVPGAHLVRGPPELSALHLSALSGGFHHNGRQPLGQLGETLMGFWKDLEHIVKNTWGYYISISQVLHAARMEHGDWFNDAHHRKSHTHYGVGLEKWKMAKI